MAGKLVLSTLNDDTGVLATQNGMSGIAKAWINFNPNNPVVNNASFNISSITRTATGQFTLNFTTAMVDTNYAAVFGGRGPVGVQSGYVENNDTVVRTTTQLNVYALSGAGFSPSDSCTKESIAIFR
jgi:hypothetical protein